MTGSRLARLPLHGTESDMVPTSLKGFGKKWRMCRIITNVIWRLEKTLARDRMKEFSLLSHQKGSLRGDLIMSTSHRKKYLV